MTGDLLAAWTPQCNEPPTSNPMTFDKRNGIPVLDADDSTDEYAVFSGTMPPNYGGGGVVVKILWTGATATTGNTVWEAAFERGDTDMDADSFASAQPSGQSAASGTSGIKNTASIPFTDGAQMDSVVAGDDFRLKINRDANSTTATDDMTGDAEVRRVLLYEA